MVVKLIRMLIRMESLFESCVVLDGSQTSIVLTESNIMFESCVVLDGSQTNTGKNKHK